MPQLLQTAVAGATGYAGFELARLLSHHPRLAKPLLFTREAVNANGLADLYPQIAGNGNLNLQPFDWQTLSDRGVELLFLATPHETSRAWAPEALKRGVRVIDLSGAWRLKHEAHRAVYGFDDADPEAMRQVSKSAVYGLPELRVGEIRY
jgi:N-acetyl-gamma-glutamyl-phosphate reductase